MNFSIQHFKLKAQSTMNFFGALLLIFFIYPFIISSNKIFERVAESNKEQLINRNLCQSASEIAKKFFFRYQYVALIPAYESKENRQNLMENEQYQETMNLLINYFVEFSCVHIVYKPNENPFIKCYNFILIIKNAATLSANLELIPRSKFKSTGRVIIIVKKIWMSKQDVIDNIKEILKVCWELRMINVVALAYYGEGVSVFTHFPFGENECNDLKIVEMDQWIDNAFVENVQLYPNKMNQLYGCPIIVTVVEKYPHIMVNRYNNETLLIDGMEAKLINLLAKLMNFTVTVVEPEDEHTWGNWDGERWTGATGDLVYNRADIGVGAYYPSLSRVDVIDTSDGYDTIYIVWTVKKIKMNVEGLKLLFPFKIFVWISIILTIVISISVLMLLKRWIKNETFQAKSIVMYFWEITLGLSIKYMPTGRFICYIFTIWIWTSMILRSTYQSSLVGFLTRTYYEDAIQTMKDLLDNNFKFFGNLQIVDVMINVTDDEYVKEILSKLNVINATVYDEVTEEIALGHIHGTIPHLKDRVAQLNYKFRGKGMIRILKQTYRAQIITCAFPKHSPLQYGINHWLNQILAVGLVDKWLEDLQWPKVVEDKAPLVLQIHHVVGPFLILFFGELIAVIVFIIEILYVRFKNNKKFEKNVGVSKDKWKI